MADMKKKIEVTANLLVCLAAVAVLGLLVEQRFFSDPTFTVSKEAAKTIVGQKLDVQGIQWREPKTVVLALSVTCRYCRDSTPFYQQLSELRKQRHFRLIAVFPQDVKISEAYMQNSGLSADVVLQGDLARSNVISTPTLMLVNDEGIVSAAWVGLLGSRGQKDVLSKL